MLLTETITLSSKRIYSMYTNLLQVLSSDDLLFKLALTTREDFLAFGMDSYCLLSCFTVLSSYVCWLPCKDCFGTDCGKSREVDMPESTGIESTCCDEEEPAGLQDNILQPVFSIKSRMIGYAL